MAKGKTGKRASHGRASHDVLYEERYQALRPYLKPGTLPKPGKQTRHYEEKARRILSRVMEYLPDRGAARSGKGIQATHFWRTRSDAKQTVVAAAFGQEDIPGLAGAFLPVYAVGDTATPIVRGGRRVYAGKGRRKLLTIEAQVDVVTKRDGLPIERRLYPVSHRALVSEDTRRLESERIIRQAYRDNMRGLTPNAAGLDASDYYIGLRQDRREALRALDQRLADWIVRYDSRKPDGSPDSQNWRHWLVGFVGERTPKGTRKALPKRAGSVKAHLKAERAKARAATRRGGRPARKKTARKRQRATKRKGRS